MGFSCKFSRKPIKWKNNACINLGDHILAGLWWWGHGISAYQLIIYITATSISSSCVHILLFYRCVKNGVIPRIQHITYVTIDVFHGVIPRKKKHVMSMLPSTSREFPWHPWPSGSYLTWVVSHMCHGQKMDETTVLGVINLFISIWSFSRFSTGCFLPIFSGWHGMIKKHLSHVTTDHGIYIYT